MTSLFISLISIYILVCIGLYFFQEKLIFFPPSPIENSYKLVKNNEIEFLINGKKTHGWKIDNSDGIAKTIIYFGGNAEDVIYFNEEAKAFNVQQAITFNHPGYGKSSGTPSQKSLYENALNSYDWAVNEYNLAPQDIIIVGRSLGSSVATYLAANRKVAGLILITPFDSIKNIAVRQYKFLPVSFLIKHPFPTLQYISQISVPVLMLAAEKDEIISADNLKNLIKYTKENDQLIEYKDTGHNTIQSHPNYYTDINTFIRSLEVNN